MPNMNLWGIFKIQTIADVMLERWKKKLGAVVHTCNSSTLEAEVERFWIWGHPGLHSKTLFKKKEKKERKM
jgi:hypothetical protein